MKLGRVLILPLPTDLDGSREPIGKAYAEVLGCDAVLRDAGPISGDLREPQRELLWGRDGPGTNTETVHLEGGIRYAMDAARVMWSAGNVNERQRIAPLVQPGETVVDLFAGIGYFAVPVAAKSRAARVIACERNPVAHGYLQRNAQLNKVQDKLEARLGDCNEVAPRAVADRVLMGYTVATQRFLPTALAALKPEGGVLHYHEAEFADKWQTTSFARVREAAEVAGRSAKLLRQHVVKTYAPGKVHVVVDAEVR